ncbi:magnesium transporter [Rhodospirillaceae bacterium KN72]|uniref:Magnesium transporter MgtE n=1 Tax=Pacificispira spongiicola TaxID=2729598 RepID=A0A7Y0HHE2_9PROT|nr:magnesium transporter [Pacificispira spongiicola]NMM46628.1 magnesium transporter [Pacificispira spongiicola]
MSDVLEKTEETEGDAFDDLYGLTKETVAAVEAALEEGAGPETIRPLVVPLHAADLADLLERLTKDERLSVVHALGEELDSDVFAYLDDTVQETITDALPNSVLSTFVQDLDSDDVVDFLEDMDEEDQKEILSFVPAEDRALYEQALSYPEYTAGRLMRRETVTIPEFWTVGQTIDFMRDSDGEGGSDLPDDFYNIIVVSPNHKPVGLVQLSKLLRTKRIVPVSAIMETDPKLIPVDLDQEDAAFLFRQYGLVEAPVIDESGRLVGVLTIDDIVDVMDEEHEDDMLKLGGVSEDDFYSDFLKTTRLRFSWLLVNLGTAIVASLVIALFETALSKVVALAVLMPIVASMGGNAGTQTLTVAVRALATNELTTRNALRILTKEVLVGSANGILFAIIMGIVAWLWFSDPVLGGVIATAMILNLMIAGLSGVLIPLAIEKIGQDPAIASTVFLTTITDVVGFFVFLGLASVVLM